MTTHKVLKVILLKNNVEQMLALHKQLSEARTGQEQTLIRRQIDATTVRLTSWFMNSTI